MNNKMITDFNTWVSILSNSIIDKKDVVNLKLVNSELCKIIDLEKLKPYFNQRKRNLYTGIITSFDIAYDHKRNYLLDTLIKSREIHIIDNFNGKLLKVLHTDFDILSIIYDSDCERLYVVHKHAISIYETSDFTKIGTIRLVNEIYSHYFGKNLSIDSRYFYIGAAGKIDAYSTETKEHIATLHTSETCVETFKDGYFMTTGMNCYKLDEKSKTITQCENPKKLIYHKIEFDDNFSMKFDVSFIEWSYCKNKRIVFDSNTYKTIDRKIYVLHDTYSDMIIIANIESKKYCIVPCKNLWKRCIVDRYGRFIIYMRNSGNSVVAINDYSILNVK